MATNFKPAPRPRNVLDEFKLRMSCPPVQGGTRPGSLAVSLVKNQPHIDVYTNVPNDKNNGNIRAAMDMPTFYMLLELMENVVTLDPEQCYKVPNKNHTFFEGKRSDEPKLISTTIVGRDKDGVAFIAVVAKDRPYLKFNFLPTNYHAVIGLDGQQMSPRDTSTYMLKGWIEQYRNFMAACANTNYVEPPPREDAGTPKQSYGGGQGGNSGGGGGWKGNSGGGNNDWKNKQNNAPEKSGGGWGSDDSSDDAFPM